MKSISKASGSRARVHRMCALFCLLFLWSNLWSNPNARCQTFAEHVAHQFFLHAEKSQLTEIEPAGLTIRGGKAVVSPGNECLLVNAELARIVMQSNSKALIERTPSSLYVQNIAEDRYITVNTNGQSKLLSPGQSFFLSAESYKTAPLRLTQNHIIFRSLPM
jgi:hypothetical protein